jgi:hypothetical protein
LSRAVVILNAAADRERVAHWAMTVPWGTRVEFKEVKRSLAQNDRMWAMLTDIARQATHNGRKYTTDQWKVLFMHACGREAIEFLPALDGSAFIPWGNRSSDLSVKEMTELIEFMFAWGAEHEVTFHEPPDTQPERGGSGRLGLPAPVPDSADSAPRISATPRSGTNHQ